MTTSSTHHSRVRQIRALLAKADATAFTHEAEAFLAKAQELMTRHAIDAATLRAAPGSDHVVSRTVHISPPYASARAQLLVAVARHNGCRVLSGRPSALGQRCEVFGLVGDIEPALALHEHLAVQAARAVLRARVGIDRPRRFRHAFLLAYAHRIDQRLAAASARACAAASAADGPGVDLVLRDRREVVDRVIAERYPNLATRRVTASSGAGIVSGEAAADRASLGSRELGDRWELPRGQG